VATDVRHPGEREYQRLGVSLPTLDGGQVSTIAAFEVPSF
jgi:hypothetical protein